MMSPALSVAFSSAAAERRGMPPRFPRASDTADADVERQQLLEIAAADGFKM